MDRYDPDQFEFENGIPFIYGADAATYARLLDEPDPWDDLRPEGPEPVERWETRGGSVLTLGYRYDNGMVSTHEIHFPRSADPADWPDLPF